MPDNPALKPPPEHAHLRWHWLIPDSDFDEPIPCAWSDGAWKTPGFGCIMTPEVAAKRYAYIGPCDPAATTIDPNDPEMVECVARALASDVFDMGDTDAVLANIVTAQWPNYADTARITLTALATRANTRKPPAE